MPHAPIIGIDVGDKYVGVAMSDLSCSLASPVGTFTRAKGEAEQKLIRLLADHKVELLISGLPLAANGKKNEQCLKVENFCRRLQKRIEVRIEYVDEYASTCEAEDLLRTTKRGRKSLKHSGKLDAASATVILQSYLDRISAASG